MSKLYFLLSLFFFISQVIFTQVNVPDSNTVALWHFDEESGATIYDASSNHNDGYGTGTIVPGMYGNARSFNGTTDYFTIPLTSSLANFLQMTIDAWVKPISIDLGAYASSEVILWNDEQEVNKNFYLGVRRNEDNSSLGAYHFDSLRFVFFYGGLTVFSQWHLPNQWYHVVATYNGTSGKVYVDGVLENTTVGIKPPIVNSKPLYINHHIWGGGAYSSSRMGGLIDEIHLSKIARDTIVSPGTISGTVYEDINDNGIKDAGELGLEHWRIDLFQNGLQVDSAFTNASGFYEFASVAPGIYTMRENVKPEWMPTEPPTGEYKDIFVGTGQSIVNKNFGNYKSHVDTPDSNTVALWHFDEESGATIYDASSNHNDGYGTGTVVPGMYGNARSFNGTTDYFTIPFTPSLANFPQMTIDVWVKPTSMDLGDYASSEGIVWNDETEVSRGFYLCIRRNEDNSSLGAYHFDSLRFVLNYGGLEVFSQWHRPNNWYHVVTTYNGTSGKVYVNGVLENVIIGVKPPVVNRGSLYINHHMWGGGAYSSSRMGGLIDEIHISKIARDTSISAIGGVVFDDLNGNGTKEAGENGLENWRIDLYKNDLHVDSTTTDASGFYMFTSVPPGTYTVREEVKPQWISTYPSLGEYTNVDIVAGQSVFNKNFGNFQLCSITGQVYYDADGNGLKDSDEYGLANVPVHITGTMQDSTLTDEYGNYTLNRLTSGMYQIRIDLPKYFGVTYPLSGLYSISISLSGQLISNMDFGITQIPQRVKLGLRITDASMVSAKTVYWGVRAGASAGIWRVDPNATLIDSSEGEYELPPVVNGTFDARFIGNLKTASIFGNGSWTDIRGFLSASQIDTYRVTFQPGPAGYPITLKWSKGSVKDAYLGSVTIGKNHGLSVDMKNIDSLVIDNSSTSEVNIIASSPNLPVMYEAGWNLISIPNNVIDGRAISIFKEFNSKVFSYNPVMGYEVKDTLKHSTGYWMKFPSIVSSILYSGSPIMSDTIDVSLGWNLIGSLSVPIPVSSISSEPSGIVTGNFFSYHKGYQIADVLQPSVGYWVKVNQDGKLILSTSAAIRGSNRIKIVPTSELPPAPPSESQVLRGKPKEYLLGEAYPNPFNPTTTIEYQLPVESRITLKVYNLLGQVVDVLADEVQSAGYRTVHWNASTKASGLYVYRLEATNVADPSDSFVQIKKMVLLK